MMRLLLSGILILALFAETGCAKRIPVDIYPIHHASDRVKPKDKVTVVLRDEMTINGKAGADSLHFQPVEWKTKALTGQLVTWNDRVIAVRVTNWQPGEDATFEIPLDQLDAVDRLTSTHPGPILAMIGVLAAIVAVSFLLTAVLSKPHASRSY